MAVALMWLWIEGNVDVSHPDMYGETEKRRETGHK